jgi:cold shock CspA family protein
VTHGPEMHGPDTLGTVAEFDDEVGLGVIVTATGGSFPFHCVAIADGSRRIAPGTTVEFTVIPKLGGREAWSIKPR